MWEAKPSFWCPYLKNKIIAIIIIIICHICITDQVENGNVFTCTPTTALLFRECKMRILGMWQQEPQQWGKWVPLLYIYMSHLKSQVKNSLTVQRLQLSIACASKHTHC